MTRQTFYRKLRKHADKFTWSVVDGSIRGYCNGWSFCPINAVYYAETNRKLLNAEYGTAARNMGLEIQDYSKIARSADLYEESLDFGEKYIKRTILSSVNVTTK